MIIQDNLYRIGFHLPALSESNCTIHQVTVDNITANFQPRSRYLKRFETNFQNIADLHNFEVWCFCFFIDLIHFITFKANKNNQ